MHRLRADGAQIAVTVRYGNVMKNERLRDCWDDIRVIEADLRNRGALPYRPTEIWRMFADSSRARGPGLAAEDRP